MLVPWTGNGGCGGVGERAPRRLVLCLTTFDIFNRKRGM